MRNRIAWYWLFGVIVLGAAGFLLIRNGLDRDNGGFQVNSTVFAGDGASDPDGYTRSKGPIPITFPDDHGPHPDYQTEWWYYTGNLTSTEGDHFGYQLTFFRRSLIPPDLRTTRLSDWGADQVYMAHFALTDVNGEEYQAFEALERGTAGLAGAGGDPFQVWLDDWRVSEIEPGIYRLEAEQDDVKIILNLTDQKGPILQGNQGYSRKGQNPGNGSYYVSLPRLSTTGVIQKKDKQYQVEGLSWMDHEWSTSALSADQVGWDWFSLQLDDGSDLMLFQIRKADGSIDRFSSGMWIYPDGSTRLLTENDFRIQTLDTWTSPHTRAAYPSRWRVEIPIIGAFLEISPYLADQELNAGYTYWEGASRVQGSLNGAPVTGSGYVELTGYAGSMAGEF